MRRADQCIAQEKRWSADNYASLPVVLSRGLGAEAWDIEGKRYLDFMGAYSAANLGHCHPRIVRALTEQACTLGVVSRAFHNDKLGAFLQKACETTGMDRALPMNSGAEAVETALKAARKWAYEVKGVPDGKAEIICCARNFHGRTTGVISMSSSDRARAGYGPYLGGFRNIPFGDADALAAAIGPHTAAFLVEPIQGEAGIIVPPPGYLRACADLCRRHNVLFIADEIQTGLGRAGHVLACQEDDARPDGVVLGKALGGGMVPVSLFLARRDVMDVFRPGDHGSTFGGYPLAAAVGHEALCVMEDEQLCQRSRETGGALKAGLQAVAGDALRDVRGCGLMIGVELAGADAPAGRLAHALLERGVLCKNVDEHTIRLAPPLNIPPALVEEFLHVFAHELTRL
ncbi:ornithine--oxo-acid transaminase [Achromobacter xylosoxidans]